MCQIVELVSQHLSLSVHVCSEPSCSQMHHTVPTTHAKQTHSNWQFQQLMPLRHPHSSSSSYYLAFYLTFDLAFHLTFYLAFLLTSILTFYLTFDLTFYLTFSLT